MGVYSRVEKNNAEEQLLNNPARLLSDWATSGCSGPSTFSRMACDRSYSGSASLYLPCITSSGLCAKAVLQKQNRQI